MKKFGSSKNLVINLNQLIYIQGIRLSDLTVYCIAVQSRQFILWPVYWRHGYSGAIDQCNRIKHPCSGAVS